jgi:hypothetical protein
MGSVVQDILSQDRRFVKRGDVRDPQHETALSLLYAVCGRLTGGARAAFANRAICATLGLVGGEVWKLCETSPSSFWLSNLS